VSEVDIRRTQHFARWLRRLRDREARARVLVRVRRLSLGDVTAVGGGVSELKIDYGPGYRLYITPRGSQVVVLLAGGGKRTQRRYIELARRMAAEYREG